MARSNSILRLADFLIGVPFVIALRIVTRRSVLPATPKRVGVICPTAIGDLILASGLLMNIHERFPDAEIHLFHGKSNAGVVPLLPLPVVGHECDFRMIRRIVRCLRDSGLDLVVDITPWPRITAIAACLSGAATVGYRTKGQFRHFSFCVAVLHRDDRHEIENLQAIAELFGGAPDYRAKLREPIGPLEIGLVLQETVLCHPCPGGTRAVDKRWPNERWARLAERLLSLGYRVGFTGGAADKEVVDDILDRIAGHTSQVVSLCGDLSLEEMSYAVRHCRAFVTVDTGVLHLASVMNAPTVALMGPTDFRRWGATSGNCTHIQSSHPQAGYISLGFEKCSEAREVMRRISVDEVLDAVKATLEKSAKAAACESPQVPSACRRVELWKR